MKEDLRNAYVYRHTKAGTSEVFYIGIGTSPDFFRAKTKHGRNRWWKHIVEKHGFDYEILSCKITKEEAGDLEKILISYYKRMDCCGGQLCNLTDGGEGLAGIIKSPKSIERWKKSNKGKQDGEKNSMFGKVGGLHHLSREVIHLETGIFFDCALDACEGSRLKYSNFKSKLNGRASFNDTGFMYADDFEKGIKPKVQVAPTANVQVIYTKTLEIFPSIKKAADYLGIAPQVLNNRLKNGNSGDLVLLEDYNKGIKRESKRGHKKYVLDTQTGIFYDSLRDVSICLNIPYTTFKNWLSGRRKNPTSLIYC